MCKKQDKANSERTGDEGQNGVPGKTYTCGKRGRSHNGEAREREKN